MTDLFTPTDHTKLVSTLGHCISVLRAIQYTTESDAHQKLAREVAASADVVWHDAMRKIR